MLEYLLHRHLTRISVFIRKISPVFFILGGFILFCPLCVQAASWEWSSTGTRERITVRLDDTGKEQATVRTSPNSLDIQLDGNPGALNRNGQAPGANSLVSNLESVGNSLRLNLRDPAFGYIIQRGNNVITLEIFPDPLGARWQPSDTKSVVLPPNPARSPDMAQAPLATAGTNTTTQTAATSQQNAAPAGTNTPTSSQPQTPAQTANQTAISTEASPGTITQNQTGQASPAQTRIRQGSQNNAQITSQQADAAQDAVQTTQAAQAGQVFVSPQNQPSAPFTSGGILSTGQSETGQIQPGQTQTSRAQTNQVQVNSGQTVQAQTSQVQTNFQAGQVQPGQVTPGPIMPDQAISASPQTNTQVTESQTPATDDGQRSIVAPRTSGRDIQVNIQVNQPNVQNAPDSATSAPVPAGMPGAVPGALAPLAVSSGMVLPIQPDPPSETVPSTEVLREITRRIENSSIPAQQVQLPPATNGLSHPTAPPPAQSDNNTNAASETASSAVTQTEVAAPAATGEAAAEQISTEQGITQVQNRHLIEDDGSSLRARFNPNGPQDWPENEAISTVVELPPDTLQAEGQGTAADADNGEQAQTEQAKEPEIIYVDEQGNPVPKPLDVNAMVSDARRLIQAGQFEQALEILQQVKDAPMSKEKREEVLYLISDATTGKYSGKWLEGYEPIVASTSEAMNANLRSPQVPRALERLGMINLRTGNQEEAKGYFDLLRRQYPYDPAVPELYNNLGEDQLKNGQYAEAVNSFHIVVQDYSAYDEAVKKASRNMVEALYKQGHYEKAVEIIDFVDKRFARIYISHDPSYLLTVADTQFRRGLLDNSLNTYWIYYNLLPDNKTNDQLLLNMGSIYLLKGDLDSSSTLFEELLRKYPRSSYAPLAILRQAEEGIFEGNLDIDSLFTIFSRPNMRGFPEAAYERILRDYPESNEAVLSALRLAVWRLWNREYSEAMNLAEQFLQKHGNTPYASRADEIILRAFAVELVMDLEEQNYERILSRWERFPQIRGAYANMDDELRVALARAQLNRGNENEGFALLEPFLERPQDPKYGEYVYKLNLARFLRNENWQGIVDLGEKVKNWNLPQVDKNELNYAIAIARENMGQTQEAVPMWALLYKRDDVPLYQKAYANYFMARDAERRRNISEAYELNRASLDLFRRLEVEQPQRADNARVQESLVALMDVTEVANRFAEALEWAGEYAPFVPENSPEYAAYRFRMARLYRKIGDLARWQYYLEEIIKREPDSVFGQMAASELRTHQVARDLSRFAPNS